ncbi:MULTISPECIES: winged helix-turn-helix transcriptional regulator [Streptomyces]|uniref:winged helix-turn-helix transcriptional regulator n=1 Tax=Streptomyces TaxID=1883 RepID=UPI00073DF2A7|nr:winged helix-turn-helix transcriptional regulator [Streptomyces sp. FBKL.4005]MYU31000.1 transcriptional regulator [Streptomyces sp. SID7810]OYP14503.1 transcriptional regulator [Streptomyces sp. FBKL.4005]CUW32097.1 HTH-type transcriptional regulator YodB [Streptomyces reticuli]
MSPRRSYDQYCSAARALDLVGDRWTLLIVRELLAGPRRYTDLHADLPGVSTDVLASRLKDMERDGLTTRRRLPPPGAAYVYELTARGRELLPVLQALGTWGEAELGERRPTDAVRAHWFALPLLRALESEGAGEAALAEAALIEVSLEEGDFHLRVGAGDGPVYGDGAAPGEPDARLVMDAATCEAIARGETGLPDAVRAGRVAVTGDGTVAKALREA